MPRHVDPLALQLVDARRRQNVTQAELARRIGTSRIVISRWENGAASPVLAGLRKWAEALNHDLSAVPQGAKGVTSRSSNTTSPTTRPKTLSPRP